MTYTVHMTYSEKTIRQLVKAQYNEYGLRPKLILGLMAVVLISYGVFGGLGEMATVLFLMAGCWLAASMQYPAKRMAKGIIQQYQGKYPAPAYCFTENGIEVSENTESRTIAYAAIDRIAEDQAWFYLFLNATSGIAIDKAMIQPNQADGFRTLLTNQTGLEVRKANATLLESIYRAIRTWIQNKGLPRIKH